MTKREFLKELEDRLQMLDEKERKDMIEEYSQHINMRMESGMKEEEAIDDFGDIDDLIAEILEAYHLDPEYEIKNKEKWERKNREKRSFTDLLPKELFARNSGKGQNAGIYAEQGEKHSGRYRKNGNNRNGRNNINDRSNINDTNDRKNIEKTSGLENTFSNFNETRYIESATAHDLQKGREKHSESVVGNAVDGVIKTGGSAISWSWDKVKRIFRICVKLVLFFVAIPLLFFDAVGIFGLGLLVVMAFQGYPIFGAVIMAIGAVLSMTAFIVFLFTYIFRGRGAKA